MNYCNWFAFKMCDLSLMRSDIQILLSIRSAAMGMSTLIYCLLLLQGANIGEQMPYQLLRYANALPVSKITEYSVILVTGKAFALQSNIKATAVTVFRLLPSTPNADEHNCLPQLGYSGTALFASVSRVSNAELEVPICIRFW